MKSFLNILNWSILALLIGLILSCGNKGPLTIPDASNQTTQQPFGV